MDLKKQNRITKLTESEPTALVGWVDVIITSIICQQWWHILVHETLNCNELKIWVVYSPRIAFLREQVWSWTFWDGFTLFPFICWHSVVFTSFHSNTNVEIFADGLFLREAYYYMCLSDNESLWYVLGKILKLSPLENYCYSGNLIFISLHKGCFNWKCFQSLRPDAIHPSMPYKFKILKISPPVNDCVWRPEELEVSRMTGTNIAWWGFFSTGR